ncbi:MAG: lactonase family protein [Burkholderiales bacterium]
MTERAAALYASVGAELIHYTVDAGSATLERQATASLPANVQYAWPHPSKPFLYVATSPRGPGEGGSAGGNNHLNALRIGERGELRPHGAPAALHARPIHMSIDRTGRYAITAYNAPSGLTVHRINDNGTLGAQVEQPLGLDGGIYAHQVLVTPSNKMVILVTRGNSAREGTPEDPGALKLFRFDDGRLANAGSVAPGGGYGFGPRHLDFHPSKPWVYVSLERQNKLQLFALEGEGLGREPLFTTDLLAEPRHARSPRQLGGTVHVHPNGRFVYVANRADSTVEHGGQRVLAGGENSIAAFEIDSRTGEPRLIQHVDPLSIHVRTFALDPSARILVAASTKSLLVREGAGVKNVPAALTVFCVDADGKLEFARKYDVDIGDKLQFWMGIVALPRER